MAEASIPVDLFNPGQLFACLGFLEAADVLLGDAEGGFDWSDAANVRFRVRANGDENPFDVVLGFLANAELRRCAPMGYSEGAPGSTDLFFVDSFPQAEADAKTLPIRLGYDGHYLEIGHWCDGSSRRTVKMYAGQQRGPAIARAMLEGIALLWNARGEEMRVNPFGLLIPMGGSFNFDARKAWTALC